MIFSITFFFISLSVSFRNRKKSLSRPQKKREYRIMLKIKFAKNNAWLILFFLSITGALYLLVGSRLKTNFIAAMTRSHKNINSIMSANIDSVHRSCTRLVICTDATNCFQKLLATHFHSKKRNHINSF